MSRLATRLLAVLVPSVLLVPAAAHAEKAVFDDATGDAKALNLAGELAGEGGPMFLDAPAEASVDITRTGVAYGTKRLTVTVHLRDLGDPEEHSTAIRIFTPDARYSLSAISIPGVGGVVDFSGGDRKGCPTAKVRYDETSDTVTASLATACIGAPRWFQVGVGASRAATTPQDDGSVNIASFADDGFRSGLSAQSLGRSPKVRRG